MNQRANFSDVIVIGAGAIGAACAWRLAQAGLKVIVLERDAPGSQASQAALGVLSFHAKPELPRAVQDLCIRSSKGLFPATLEELAEVNAGQVSYQAGGQLGVALSEADKVEMDLAYELNAGLGVEVERATPEECRLLEPGVHLANYGGVFFPQDAWVDNTAFTLALVQAGKQAGVNFQRDHVVAVESALGRVTGVRCEGGRYEADCVLLAAGCWSGQIKGVPPLPVRPVRGQALSLAGRAFRRVVMSPRAYLVPKGDGQTMVGATVEHVGFEPHNTLGGLQEITTGAWEIAPTLAAREFIGAWAGLRPGTPDNLPYIGPFAELPNLVAATGHFRSGILLAPITAELVRTTIIAGEPLTDLQPFLPSRAGATDVHPA